ncbi:hypothetical protein DIPPA_00998 [Diplonema papillatum]|nr:hypothetical protein DIPPA_00998 [Diplonema papillatum]
MIGGIGEVVGFIQEHDRSYARFQVDDSGPKGGRGGKKGGKPGKKGGKSGKGGKGAGSNRGDHASGDPRGMWHVERKALLTMLRNPWAQLGIGGSFVIDVNARVVEDRSRQDDDTERNVGADSSYKGCLPRSVPRPRKGAECSPADDIVIEQDDDDDDDDDNEYGISAGAAASSAGMQDASGTGSPAPAAASLSLPPPSSACSAPPSQPAPRLVAPQQGSNETVGFSIASLLPPPSENAKKKLPLGGGLLKTAKKRKSKKHAKDDGDGD